MTFRDLDPFDLPEWLATEEVVWRPAGPLGQGHHVDGELNSPAGTLACDVLFVDQAYPAPVADNALRTRAHRAWHHDQVLVVELNGRLTLAVPGARGEVEQVLRALARLSLAVGAPAEQISAWLSLGDTDRGHPAR